MGTKLNYVQNNQIKTIVPNYSDTERVRFDSSVKRLLRKAMNFIRINMRFAVKFYFPIASMSNNGSINVPYYLIKNVWYKVDLKVGVTFTAKSD